VFRAPNDQESAALTDLVAGLKDVDVAKAMIDKKNADMGKDPADLTAYALDNGDDLQALVFAVGKNHGFGNLREWFQAIYEVLLGASQGPRFGGFIALYGVDETIALVESGLKGELV
jgi:lysyl-tRNA synthetase class 1